MRETPFWLRLLKAAALHAAAGGIVVAAAVALATVLYFVLFGLALVTGQTLGGPLALPFMTVTTFLATVGAVVALLWPVTAITGLLCERVLRWPRIAQIPVSASLLFAGVCVAMTIASHYWQPGEPLSWSVAFVTWIALLPALTLYWWVLRVPRLLARIVGYFQIQRSGF